MTDFYENSNLIGALKTVPRPDTPEKILIDPTIFYWKDELAAIMRMFNSKTTDFIIPKSIIRISKRLDLENFFPIREEFVTKCLDQLAIETVWKIQNLFSELESPPRFEDRPRFDLRMKYEINELIMIIKRIDDFNEEILILKNKLTEKELSEKMKQLHKKINENQEILNKIYFAKSSLKGNYEKLERNYVKRAKGGKEIKEIKEINGIKVNTPIIMGDKITDEDTYNKQDELNAYFSYIVWKNKEKFGEFRGSVEKVEYIIKRIITSEDRGLIEWLNYQFSYSNTKEITPEVMLFLMNAKDISSRIESEEFLEFRITQTEMCNTGIEYFSKFREKLAKGLSVITFGIVNIGARPPGGESVTIRKTIDEKPIKGIGRFKKIERKVRQKMNDTKEEANAIIKDREESQKWIVRRVVDVFKGAVKTGLKIEKGIEEILTFPVNAMGYVTDLVVEYVIDPRIEWNKLRKALDDLGSTGLQIESKQVLIKYMIEKGKKNQLDPDVLEKLMLIVKSLYDHPSVLSSTPAPYASLKVLLEPELDTGYDDVIKYRLLPAIRNFYRDLPIYS